MTESEPIPGRLALPGRGPGSVATLAFGPADRPIDLVFLHANGFNALTYRSLLAPLGKDLRILAFDQRGHGRTTLTTETAGRADWLDLRDDLLALLEVLEIEDTVLAGHSMGGTVSLFAAARTPERARRLVLLDPVMAAPSAISARRASEGNSVDLARAALRRRTRFASREAAIAAYVGRGAFATWPRQTIADFAEDGFADLDDGSVSLACAPAWEASNYAAQAHEPWGALGRAAKPVHILRAERESTCRVEGREAGAAACGPARIETVPGTTHFLPMERPDVARAALLEAARPIG